MKSISNLLRIVRINYILVRYNLDEVILASPLCAPIRFLKYFNPYYWLLKNKLTRAERIRLAIESLGPIFVKAGQILSTRTDLLPEDIAEELTKLQDCVPPFSGHQAKKIIELTLKDTITNLFKDFEITALASASIAQVHAATLQDGSSVVVKVLRPNVRKQIERDLNLLEVIASSAEKYWKESRRFKPREIVAEIAHTLFDELDLLREGANASQLRRNFQHSSLLYIPEIYWSYSRSNMLVMERIDGIPIHNIAALKNAGINMKKLAERGIEVFFTQVFRDCFFHADMHPGNIFISRNNLEDPLYIAVDFGIVGSLSADDQRYLAENMLAFFKRDYKRVAALHIESGWLPPSTRVDQFEGAIRAVCEPIFEKPLKDISFGQLLLRLFQTASRFQINIQPQLILLQKTLLNVEGIGRQLYPELDLWQTAAPFLEKWLKKQVGLRAFLRKVRTQFPYWSEKLPELPGLVYDILVETKREKEVILAKEKDTSLKRAARKYYFLYGLGSAFLISAGINWIQFPELRMWEIFAGLGALFILLGVLGRM